MISTALLELWYAHVSVHMRGFVRGGVLVVDGEGVLQQRIATSDDFVHSHQVQESVESVIKKRKAVVRKLQSENSQQSGQVAGGHATKISSIHNDTYLVCSPVFIERELSAVACVELIKRRDDRTHDVLHEVEVAVQWLSSLSGLNTDTPTANASIAIQISAIALSQESAPEAAIAVVSALAHHLKCDRVALAFGDRSDVNLYALSNSANYDTRQNMISRIESVIQEAIDQKETLVYPPGQNSFQFLQAHTELSKHNSSEYICSVPVVLSNEIVGGICFERNSEAGEFSDHDIEICEQLTCLVGPVLEYRRRDDRALSQKLISSLSAQMTFMTGSKRPGARSLAVVLLILVIASFFIQWNYRVTANASLEGAVERVITAPEAGFIKTASSRPGDVLAEGYVLATLDDRDLRLEKQKWSGKQQQVSREYREALASHDRSKIGILRAQLDQAEAQLAILDKKLQRTMIKTPIAGVVVSGDYTRSLGAPVEKGQILYTVSPLDDYRILLEVDEADVTNIEPGMRGELTLSAAAAESYSFIINKITPVSRSENGKNYFQVEASLESTPEFLRPGMQGAGKIDVGKRQLLWIWTHKMMDWLRLKLWVWW